MKRDLAQLQRQPLAVVAYAAGARAASSPQLSWQLLAPAHTYMLNSGAQKGLSSLRSIYEHEAGGHMQRRKRWQQDCINWIHRPPWSEASSRLPG